MAFGSLTLEPSLGISSNSAPRTERNPRSQLYLRSHRHSSLQRSVVPQVRLCSPRRPATRAHNPASIHHPPGPAGAAHRALNALICRNIRRLHVRQNGLSNGTVTPATPAISAYGKARS